MKKFDEWDEIFEIDPHVEDFSSHIQKLDFTKIPKSKKNTIEEIVYRDEFIFLCLFINRKERTIRIIDFRTGYGSKKLQLIEDTIAKENLHKAFILTERDELSTWQKVGFITEGIIPGYYKRSDAYFMSKVYGTDINIVPFCDDNLFEDQRNIEKEDLIFKENDKRSSNDVKVRYQLLTHEEASDYLKENYPNTKPLIELNPFGRNSEWIFLLSTLKRKKQGNIIVAEYQDCFGNAKIDIMLPPQDEEEKDLIVTGIKTLLSGLVDKSVVSAFAVIREDLKDLNELFSAAGFKQTGFLNHQIVENDKFINTLLWTKKLVNLPEL